ncbi:LexA family transcriptional regulator [Salmonella enterica]|uniref:LexA family transcriptional regulator n=1 Tax=Salmonella enterica subsp. enterica serovar Stanley TaxID=192953 RepID=A0A5X0ZP28_SALET|nr:LexA family transcriptional regulator [Salmonella enterica subsp. enterica serovar Stanley]EDZ6154261.1 LexA family transcriptional regulator [Salmonella enterica]EBY8674668.1 LexA family transcriptional regulator [Salmonella enterica subsp. enterica serovar Stanley]ECD0499255.1 LexA family transcriptional regulator [Salmonella enterica subsp. enterica serovar Stanley]ECD4848583.1 LexA family transcriptional regulator [Salmonella enterica subsp. enterica serovar Stanley]
MKQANEWIEWYVTTFRDVSTQEGETYLSAVQSKRRTIAMDFPSPASDYVETRISLDQQLISQPAATYFMRASRSHFREGIIQGALLVVDASLSACDGSLLICAIDGEFRIKRYRTHPQPHLINLENGRKEALPEDGDGYNSSHAIFGVITYIINDARNAEFDDCPVM